MSKKLFSLISLVLIATFVLAACGPAATTAAPTTAPQPTTPPATSAPQPTAVPPTAAPQPTATTAAKPVEIKIWHQWDGAYLDAITAAFKDYMTAHPNVTITLEKPQSVPDALKVAIPAGEGPDIIGWANDQIGTQALAGNIVPLDDYGVTQDFLKATYAPSAVNGVTYQGKIWALPESVEAIALVYNKKLVTDKYLPKDPNDWAGLLAAAQQFQKDNPGMNLLCNQGFPGGDAYHIAPVFFGFGVPMYVDETGKVYVNTPEAVKAMQWLQKISKFLPAEETDQICTAAFEQGKVGIRWTGPWAIAGIEKAGIDYGIVPMGKPFVGIKTLMLSKNAVDRGNQDVAIDIMKYFTSGDVQKKIVLANKTIPAPTAALQDPDVQKLTAVAGFGAAAAIGVPMSPSPYSGAQWGPVGDAVKVIWSGAQTPDAALAAAQTAIETAVAGMK